MKIYKIRNKNNGLFFKGGHYWNNEKFEHYNWTTAGQTYNTIRGLRTTLNQMIRLHGRLEDMEIVEFELIITSAKPLIDYINPQLIINQLKK